MFLSSRRDFLRFLEITLFLRDLEDEVVGRASSSGSSFMLGAEVTRSSSHSTERISFVELRGRVRALDKERDSRNLSTVLNTIASGEW